MVAGSQAHSLLDKLTAQWWWKIVVQLQMEWHVLASTLTTPQGLLRLSGIQHAQMHVMIALMVKVLLFQAVALTLQTHMVA